MAARLLLHDEGERLCLGIRHRVGTPLAVRHLKQNELPRQEGHGLLRPAAESDNTRHELLQRLDDGSEGRWRGLLSRALHLAEAHLDLAIALGQRLAAEDAVALAAVALAEPVASGQRYSTSPAMSRPLHELQLPLAHS